MAVSELTATGVGELDAQASAAADDTQIILPVRDTVLFPHTVLPIAIESERNIAAAQAAVKAGRRIGLLLQLDAAKENPTPEELHRIGGNFSRKAGRSLAIPRRSTAVSRNPGGSRLRSR